MQRIGAWLIHVHVDVSDDDRQRRGRLLIVLTLGLMAVSLVSVPLVTLTRETHLVMPLLASIAAYVGIIVLAYFGWINVGAYLLIGMLLTGTTWLTLQFGQTPASLFFMAIPILCSSVVLQPFYTWVVLLLAMGCVWLIFHNLPDDFRDTGYWRLTLIPLFNLLTVVSLISFLSAWMIQRILAMATAARQEAEAARQALAASNASLEAQVAERTAAFRQLAEKQAALAAQLQSSLDEQKELNRIIAGLSVPVIPICSDTLVAPIVGRLDSERTDILLNAILNRVEMMRVRTVVLDITGMAAVDGNVFAALPRVTNAIRLMGAEPMLVGVQPTVAEALLNAGIELNGLRTAATLHDGLQMLGFSRTRQPVLEMNGA